MWLWLARSRLTILYYSCRLVIERAPPPLGLHVRPRRAPVKHPPADCIQMNNGLPGITLLTRRPCLQPACTISNPGRPRDLARLS